MTQIFAINIPTAESMQDITEKARYEQWVEKQNKILQFEKDIPRFFEYIVERIKYSATNGNNQLHLNFDDETFIEKDNRVSFHFNGHSSIESQQNISEVFNAIFIEKMGYRGSMSFFTGSTYRLGEIFLTW